MNRVLRIANQTLHIGIRFQQVFMLMQPNMHDMDYFSLTS